MPAEESVTAETGHSVIESASGLLAPGCLVDGKFEILGLLGKGGMSIVYKARHLVIDRVVALKVMHGSLLAKQNSIQRFQREAATASSLHHKNIIEVSAFGIFDDQPYMAIEFLEGKSLSDLLKSQGRIAIERAVPIFAQICDALIHAHEHGVVHRDLKPSNVMLVGPNESVKLVDFGIAKVLPESGKEHQKLTQNGEVFGSPFYMSPEQCQGNVIDARSDIYSMGCLMYEVLTGQPPFVGNTSFETMGKHLDEEPSAIEFLSTDLNKVLHHALAKDPSARFQTIRELKKALLVVDQNIQDTGTKKPTQRLIGQLLGRWKPVAACVSVLVLIGGVCYRSELVKPHQAKLEQRGTQLYLNKALQDKLATPLEVEKNLLIASRLAAERQEFQYQMLAISALVAFYNAHSLTPEVPVGIKDVDALHRKLAEAKLLLSESPELKQKWGLRYTNALALAIAACADNSNQSTDIEFFLQHAYNTLLRNKRNTSRGQFSEAFIEISSKYAEILRKNGKIQKVVDVEIAMKRYRKQRAQFEAD